MPVPFEALLPWGIIATMFGVTGVGLYYTKHLGNEGKKTRWNRDLWDRVSRFSTPPPSAAVGNPNSL
ncbi:unnamed protein product [Penicillium pancosmium]